MITDHKALERLRTKPEFDNNKINRLIEKIQEYDFSIEYKKGCDVVTVDVISRLYVEIQKKPFKTKSVEN